MLGQGELMLANGEDIAGACWALEISESSFHRWRTQHGGMTADDAKLLRNLEKENATFKRLLADAELEKSAMKDGNYSDLDLPVAYEYCYGRVLELYTHPGITAQHLEFFVTVATKSYQRIKEEV